MACQYHKPPIGCVSPALEFRLSCDYLKLKYRSAWRPTFGDTSLAAKVTISGARVSPCGCRDIIDVTDPVQSRWPPAVVPAPQPIRVEHRMGEGCAAMVRSPRQWLRGSTSATEVSSTTASSAHPPGPCACRQTCVNTRVRRRIHTSHNGIRHPLT
eukprot:707467-Prorocentrum_minimum.AAC.1